MNILHKLARIPGSLMLGPMLLGMIINSTFPEVLKIGGFTSAIFQSGGTTLMGLFLFCNGTRIRFKSMGKPMIKGTTFFIWKLIVAVGVALSVKAIFGIEGIFGITFLALIPALSNTNMVMYLLLTEEYGKKDDVLGAIPLLLGEGPFITLLFLTFLLPQGASFTALLSMIIPLLIGVAIGNIKESIGDFFSGGMKIIIPFLGFNVGAILDFNTVFEAGVPGIILGLFVVVVYCASGLYLNRLFEGGRTLAGMALGTTAANSVITPSMVAMILPSVTPYMKAASAQLAAATFVSSLVCPLIFLFLQKNRKNSEVKQ